MNSDQHFWTNLSTNKRGYLHTKKNIILRLMYSLRIYKEQTEGTNVHSLSSLFFKLPIKGKEVP